MLSEFHQNVTRACPEKDKNGNDRQPPKCCFEKWVEKELKILDNEIYIIIGAKSAKVFFPKESFNELIFKDNYINGKLAIVLPQTSLLCKKRARTTSVPINISFT